LTNLEHALQYARLGWKVFPLHTVYEGICTCKQPGCTSEGKHPVNKGWQDDATTDEARITKIWTSNPYYNIGIATGRASGIFVLDFDKKDGGLDTLEQLQDEHGTFTTLEVITGSGGKHFYFKMPPEVDFGNRVKMLPGTDIRSNGGLVAAPPSMHKSGHRYEWETSSYPWENEIEEAPEWLISAIMATGTEATPDGKLPKLDVETIFTEGVKAGKIDETFFKVAAHLRQLNVTWDGAFFVLKSLAEKSGLTNSNLTEQKIKEKLKSAWKYPDGLTKLQEELTKEAEPAPPTERTKNLTDLGNAERLIAKFGKDLKFCNLWGRWLVWSGTRWVIDDTGEIVRKAKQTVRTIYREAIDEPDQKKKLDIAKHAAKSESENRIKAMVKLAESETGISVRPEDLDKDAMLLNTPNCTIDLRTGKIKEHAKSDLITKIIPVEYKPGVECKRWLEFLERIFEGNSELIGFIQKVIGYSLTGATSEQCLFFLYGNGANGKSTFLDCLRSLIGEDYCKQAASNTFMQKHSEGIPNDVAMLKGSRLVSCVETDEGKRLDESLIKQLTGGDKIAARFMRQEWFEFKPTFKIFILTNHKPIIRGSDKGIWRRIRLVPFNISIPETEQDKQLGTKLLHELPGILNWALEGCIKWQQEGLGAPKEVTEATDDYRDEMDMLSNFIEDCCIIKSHCNVFMAHLYGEYERWCSDNNEKPFSRKIISLKLQEKGFKKVKLGSAGNRGFNGIGLKSENYGKVNTKIEPEKAGDVVELFGGDRF
jgi:putative DNA primase/helicase